MNKSDHSPTNINPALAYVLPFAIYLGMASAATWQPLTSFYPLLYAVQAVVVLAVWWRLRHHYPAPTGNGMAAAVVVGVLGVIVWIVLSRLGIEKRLLGFLPGWLYSGERTAFHPFEAIDQPVAQWAFIAVRVAGLAIVVPLAEEVFWRGFLIRYLIAEDFQRVPLGTYSRFSFVVVTAMFALVHPELLAALVWGAGINVLLYRTKNLWACIVAHGVTNLLLGVYIVATGSWELW